MKYCSQCGAQCEENNLYCSNCGCKLDNSSENVYVATTNRQAMNIMCIIGFVCSFVSSILGIILCAIGLNQIKETGEDGKAFAVAGLVISGIKLAIILLFVFILYIFWFSLV